MGKCITMYFTHSNLTRSISTLENVLGFVVGSPNETKRLTKHKGFEVFLIGSKEKSATKVRKRITKKQVFQDSLPGMVDFHNVDLDYTV